MKLERRGDVTEEAQLPREAEKSPANQKKREISVIIYTLVLFVVALALILLSYKIQQRANTTLSDITEQHGEFSAQALRNIEELQQKNMTLTEELGDVREQLRDAQQRVSELETEKGSLEQEKNGLAAQISELTLKAEDLEKSALAARTLTRLIAGTEGAEREQLLRDMASLSQYLDADGQEIYTAFLESLTEAPEDGGETENTENSPNSEEKGND